jgi:hypothetical protein
MVFRTLDSNGWDEDVLVCGVGPGPGSTRMLDGIMIAAGIDVALCANSQNSACCSMFASLAPVEPQKILVMSASGPRIRKN